MKKGFTLIEMLVVVLIVGVLTGIALPKYMRSLERARATEAMANVKTLNEAVYAYASGREGSNACPTSFSKLPISIPGLPTDPDDRRTTKNFVFQLDGALAAHIPGTNCHSVTATRNAGNRYRYVIWNSYVAPAPGERAVLACTGPTQADLEVCESLGLRTDLDPNNGQALEQEEN